MLMILNQGAHVRRLPSKQQQQEQQQQHCKLHTPKDEAGVNLRRDTCRRKRINETDIFNRFY